MYAMLFGLIEIFAFGVTETPTAQVETVKAVSPADASVQLVVDHGLLKSRFSGTAIAPNLVVTCWHGFRDKGTVTVNGKPAKLLRFDAVSDVALVEVPEGQLPSVPVAATAARKGEPATAYGYEYVRQGLWKFPTKITAINRYSGFPNQSIAGRPNQGRSGGGLFNEQGELIGVCSASDGNEGLYCGLEAVKSIVNGQSVVASPARESSKVEVRSAVRMDGVLLPGASNDCPDGRCPLVKSVVRPRPEPAVVPTGPAKSGPFNSEPVGPLPQGTLSLSGCSPVSNGWHLLQPTLAPPEPRVIVQAKPLRSVMVQPVRRARVFTGRLFNRLRCR